MILLKSWMFLKKGCMSNEHRKSTNGGKEGT